MKVAIPSNDKIKISPTFSDCVGYLVYEIDDHNLVKYEFRLNNNGASGKEASIANLLDDCSSIICNNIEKPIKETLKNSNKQILKTLEEDAKKALINLMCRV
jgi:predicted Fe-Mo cluster-binding NifX family protein